MKTTTLVFGLCLILSSSAFAQEKKKPLQKVFNSIEETFTKIVKKIPEQEKKQEIETTEEAPVAASVEKKKPLKEIGQKIGNGFNSIFKKKPQEETAADQAPVEKKQPLKEVGKKIGDGFNSIFKKKPQTEEEKALTKIEKPASNKRTNNTFSTSASDDLTVNMSPKNYRKRSEAIYNIGLIYYGDYYTDSEFAQVQQMLEERFEFATDSLIKLNVVFRAIMPFKQNIANFPDYKQEYVTEIDRLQRLWYYDNMGMQVVSEVYKEAKSHDLYGKDFSNIDALAVVTGAQFDGLGFASGRVAITENPMEIAWARPSNRVEIQSDAKVVDELIHELGHTLHIGHAADQCFRKGITPEEQKACCEASPNKNDVQSYCRKRADVNEEFQFKFEECNLKNLREIVVPAMLKGANWDQSMTKCE